MEDYHCQQVTLASSQSFPQKASSSQTGTAHPLSSSFIYTQLSPNHRAFALSISSHFEPLWLSYSVSSLEAAMQAEISTLEESSA